MREYPFNKETLTRLKDVGRVLSKYGLQDIAEKLRLPRRLFTKGGRPPLSLGQKVKAILEELGPTYVKLGQALSCHPDILPREIILELEKLQEKVAPFPHSQAEKTISRTLKRPAKEIFAEFDPIPFASASLSQVHHARLPSGDKVAVKVQRPDIERTVRGDLALMSFMAQLLEKHVPEIRRYEPLRLVAEFEKSIENEIDFQLEADHYERFRENFAGVPGVYFPKVFKEFSGRDVLTLEYIHGATIDSVLRRDTTHDRHTLAQRGVTAVYKQIFEDGFFHADPHKGNLIIMKDDVVCFIDAGMVGVLDQEAKGLLNDLLIAISFRNVQGVISVFVNEGMVPDDCDLRALKEDLGDVFDRYYDIDLDRIDLGAGLRKFIGLVQKHQIKLPSVFTLLIRCLIILEGVGRQLEPGFNPIRSMMPYAHKALERQLQPREVVNDLGQFFWKNLWIIKSFPNDLLQFLHKVVKGKAEFRIDHQGLAEIGDRANKGGSRLAMSILIAGVIVASALVMKTGLPPLVRGFSLLGILGYAASLVSAVIVFFKILKDIR